MKMAAVIAILLMSPAGALAQKPTDIVHWSAKGPAAGARAGGVVRVELTAEIESGWHLYGLDQNAGGPPPLSIAVVKLAPFELRKRDIVAPAATVASDPNFNLDTQYYEGKAVFTIPIVVPATTRPGKHTIPLEVTFQACNNRMCLRPHTETVQVDVTVAPVQKGSRR
jgi:thiol:disulfide interchange protein DsbD